MPPTVQVPLALATNYLQSRIGTNRIMTLVHGGFERDGLSNRPTDGWSDTFTQLNGDGESLTYVDPVTHTLMLTPYPLLKAWQTETAGPAYRFHKADYTLITPANWKDDTKNNAAANFVVGLDSAVNEPVITAAALSRNRPIFLSWFGANWGNDKFVQMECGWSATRDGSVGVSLRFFAHGECEVWKNNQLFKKHKFTGGADNKSVEQTSGQIVAVLLIPCRRRELLVLSNRGGGFNQIFDDIDELDTDPTITDAAPFWWYVPSGKAEVECSAFGFPAAGYRCGIKTIFAEAPPAGESPDMTIYYDKAGYGVQSAAARLVDPVNPATAFNADGTAKECRLRADLMGDGSSSPFVYAGSGAYAAQIEYTDDSELIYVDEFAIACTIEAPEQFTGAKMQADFVNLNEINDVSLGGFEISSNAPFGAAFGGNVILDGLTNPPKLKDSVSDDTRIVTVETRDKTKLLENFRFKDRQPFDTMQLEDAFRLIAKGVGFADSEQAYSSFGLELPSTGGPSRGDFNVLAETGDQGSEWFERLHTNYCATAFLGIAPLGNPYPILAVLDPDDLGDLPVLDVYDSTAAALAAGVERSDLKWRVIRSFEFSTLEPESNDIYVVGLDRRYYRPIITHYANKPSQDPTTAPSLRSDQWLGEIRRYSWIDPSLSTVVLGTNAATLLGTRLFPRRYLGEFVTGLMRDPFTGVPLWRGDVFTYNRTQYGTADAYRIVSLSLTFDKEPNPDVNDIWEWHEVRYVCEKLIEGTSKGCGHKTNKTSLASIQASHAAKIAAQSNKKLGYTNTSIWQDALTRPPLFVTEL